LPKKKKSQIGQPKGITIAAAGETALEKLTPRRRAYVEARAEGKTIKASAAIAGVSNRMGGKYEKKEEIQAAYKELMQKAMPLARVVQLVKGGANATMPVWNSQGKRLKDRPDWRTRKPYIDMVREDAGYVESNKDKGNTLIAVQVEFIGRKHVESTKPVTTITAKAD
jgi:hypothetical protein